MLLNKRIHLNTIDAMGAKKSTFENHANAEFDLSRGRCICDANLDLKLGLVKSMIPPDLSIMGTSETYPVFELIVGQALVSPFTTPDFFLYFTDTKYEFPYGVGNLDSVYIPMSHIDSVETFIGVVNQLIDVVTGGAPTTLLAIDNIDNTLVATSSVNNIFIPMSLYNPKIAGTDSLNRDAYRPQNETIMRMLGININTTEPSTRVGKDTINRDIKYPVGLYKPPILVKTDLSLNSVSSNPKLSGKILASINCDIALASQSYNFIFTPATPALLATPEAAQKVNLDGSDDHINIPMDSGNPVLNWDESWSLGFTAEEIHDATSGVGVKRTIATRGTNGIYLIIGTGNVGFYASATDGHYDPANNQGMTHAHGANTWYPTPASVKWLFTYNHTTGKLRWHVGEVVNGATPSHTQRGVVTMTSTERTINQSTEDLNIGDAMSGYYGSTYFDGHLDDLLITNNELTGQQIVDYYTDDDFQSHEYSEHIVSLYNFNQEFPNVDDQVGSYNGTHQGSINPDNFISN
jgi:hypothetical protein